MEFEQFWGTKAKTILNKIHSLKCTICLDVIENFRELPCRHIFCANCLQTYKASKDILDCPLCKKDVAKRKCLNKDAAVDSLCIFMKKLCDDFERHYKNDIGTLFGSPNSLKEFLGSSDALRKSEDVIQHSSDENDVISCTVIPHNKNAPKMISKSKCSKTQGVKTKSAQAHKKLQIKKNTANKKKKKLLFITNVPTKLPPSKTTSKIDSTRKLEIKPSPPLESDVFQSSKTKILQWLHDTKNNFERFSQTQSPKVERNTVEDIDMPSVSQVSVKKVLTKKQSNENVKSDKSEDFRKRRARSVENLTQNKCVYLKRHSLECSSPCKVKQYQNLQEIESIENQLIIDIIEDEVLDAIDKEVSGEKAVKRPIKKCTEKASNFINDSKMTNEIENGYLNHLDDKIWQGEKENTRCSIEKREEEISIADKDKKGMSPWKIISKFKKSIGKSRVPKKLDISLQSSQKHKKDNQVEVKININDITVNTLDEKLNTRTVDFQKMEDYFSKAIPEMIKNNVEINTSQEMSMEKVTETKFQDPESQIKIPNVEQSLVEKNIVEITDDCDKSGSDIYIYQTQPLTEALNASNNNDIEYAVRLAKNLENLLISQEKDFKLCESSLDSIFPSIKHIYDKLYKYKKGLQEDFNRGSFGQTDITKKRSTGFSEKKIQTDLFSSDGFNITSTAAFESINYENISTQTDYFCVDCPHIDKENVDTININNVEVFPGTISIETDKKAIIHPYSAVNINSTRKSRSNKINSQLWTDDLKEDNSDVGSMKVTQTSAKNSTTSSFGKQSDNNSKICSQVIRNETKKTASNKYELKSKDMPIESEMEVEDILRQFNTQFESSLDSKHKERSYILQNIGCKTKPFSCNVDKEICVVDINKDENSDIINSYVNHSHGSAIICTLPSLKSRINCKMMFEKSMKDKQDLEKTLKRVHSMNANLESEEDMPNKVLCNRFLRDDISIEFETENYISQYSARDLENVKDHREHANKSEPATILPVKSQNNEAPKSVQTVDNKEQVQEIQASTLVNYCDENKERSNRQISQILNEVELLHCNQTLIQCRRLSQTNEISEVEEHINISVSNKNHKDEAQKKYENIETRDLSTHYDQLIERANEQIGIKKPTINSGNDGKKMYGHSQIPSTSKHLTSSKEDFEVAEERNDVRTQDLLDHCNALIEKTTRSMGKEDMKLSRNEEMVKAESQICDEFFYENLDQLDVVFEHATKNMKERVQNKMSESLFETYKEKTENEVAVEEIQTCNDFALDIHCTPKRKYSDSDNQINSKKVKILQNLTLDRNTEPIKNKVEGFNSSDDEMFSDVDVVETTPQKSKNPSFLERLSCSQAVAGLKFPLKTPEAEVYSLPPIEIVPPPPGFGDVEDDKDKTIFETASDHVTQKESDNIIPNSLSPQTIQVAPYRKPFSSTNVQTRIPVASQETPALSQEFKGLSPICQEKAKKLNVIEMVRKSKFSPLTILPRANPTSSSLTSTPKQKSILSYVKPSTRLSQNKKSDEVCSQFLSPVRVKSKPCIAYTRLEKSEILGILSLCNKKLATQRDKFGSDITHMIVSVDKNNCLKDHTIKFISAVAAGLWVLNVKWIHECLAQNIIVDEEPYEVLDISGIPSPKISRLSRHTNPLFRGYKFYVAPPFTQTTMQDVENVIQLLSGIVVSSIEDLHAREGHICIIISEAPATEDLEKYETWLKTYKVVTVDINWLSLSVSRYKVLSLKPYVLCSDDSLEELGYPPDLILDVPCSFTQGTHDV